MTGGAALPVLPEPVERRRGSLSWEEFRRGELCGDWNVGRAGLGGRSEYAFGRDREMLDAEKYMENALLEMELRALLGLLDDADWRFRSWS